MVWTCGNCGADACWDSRNTCNLCGSTRSENGLETETTFSYHDPSMTESKEPERVEHLPVNENWPHKQEFMLSLIDCAKKVY
eukprot:UN05274